MGSVQVSRLSADVSFALEVWEPWGIISGPQAFLSNITFLVLVSTELPQVLDANHYNFSSLYLNVFKFCIWKEYTSKQMPRICWHFIFSFPIFLDLILGYVTPARMYPSCFLLIIPVVAQPCHPASSCITTAPQQSWLGETKDFRELGALSVSDRGLQPVQHSDRGQIVKAGLSKMPSFLAYLQQRCGKFTDNH